MKKGRIPKRIGPDPEKKIISDTIDAAQLAEDKKFAARILKKTSKK